MTRARDTPDRGGWRRLKTALPRRRLEKFEDRRVPPGRQVRILYIVTAFPRHSDDVITPWLSETIARLRKVGMEVEVLAPSYRGLQDQVIGGIPVHRFRYAPAFLETLTHDQTTPDRIRQRPLYLALVPFYILAGTAAAVRLGRTGRFDVVHAFWPLPHGIFGLAAARLSRIPLVSTFFGVELTWVRRQLPFLAPLIRAIIRRSDAVTVISTHTAGEVRRLEPEAVVRTIPFGAAVEPRVGPDGKAGMGGFTLLFVGRLVERKGVGVLLQAVARMEPSAGVRLRIVGDGPLRPDLVRTAEELGLRDLVHFTGFVSDEELGSELDRCDALVLPAVEDAKGDVEGLGVVLIEALLHGKPVIASRSGGIPDIVKDGLTGLLVAPGDPEELAAAITRLRDDPSLAAQLAARGREFVGEEFSWVRVVGQLTSLYSDVAAAKSGGVR